MQRLALVNISLVVFNLIPAFPTDGGGVLRALLAMRLGPQRATEIAAKLGQLFAFLFVAAGLFLNPMLIFIGLFIYIAAVSELQASALRWFAHGLTVSEGMERTVRSLSTKALLSEELERRKAKFQRKPVISASLGAILLPRFKCQKSDESGSTRSIGLAASMQRNRRTSGSV